MLYSSWRADRGGYDYFESPDRLGLADDLPAPDLPGSGAIGIASTEVGRPAPRNLRHVGSGPVARGLILPLDRRGLGALDVSPRMLGWAALGLAVGVLIGRRYFR